MQRRYTNSSGFTLIELAISMVIFGIMSIMIITVYFNATNSARKLGMTRQLSETAREITERIAQDVTERGISIREPKFDPFLTYPLWNTLDYLGEGNEVLILGKPGNEHIYAYGKRNTSGGLDPCYETDKQDIRVHCGIYLKESGEYYNLVDSFIPDDEKKRVKIESLRFYVTGDEHTSKKVTLNFTLALMPRIGVPSAIVNTTKLHIQTTLSERVWKD